MAECTERELLPTGPLDGISYPLTVQYCGACTMPIEFCEYSSCQDRCKEWLQKNLPDLFESLNAENTDEKDGGDEKKHQKRGGKGSSKTKSKAQASVTSKVTLTRSLRGKNKSVTVIKGLHAYGIDLKVASKFFSQRFACGSSVTGVDEVVIQGDVKDDLFDIIPEKWNQIDEDNIDDLGDQKR